MQLNIPRWRVSTEPIGAPQVRAPLQQLPNTLTLSRVFLVPAIVVVLLGAKNGHDWFAGLLFAAAAATDQVDGLLARRWHVESEFGKRFDVVGDRLVLGSCLVVLASVHRLPWLALGLLVAREALLIVTRLRMPLGYEFTVTLLGKLSAWALYVGVGGMIVTSPRATWPVWITWLGVGLAIAAGFQYMYGAQKIKYMRHQAANTGL